MRTYIGHDTYHDRDYMLTVHDDGRHEIATRPGMTERWTTWSPPTELLPDAPTPDEQRAASDRSAAAAAGDPREEYLR